MITGFNTDIKCGGTTYHVQTEDKGESNPLIESLVYVKGQVLDSLRTSYQEYLSSGIYNQLTLQKILESQHRQLVSAIKRGQFHKGMQLEDYIEGKFLFRFNAHRVSSPARPKPVSSEEPKADNGIGAQAATGPLETRDSPVLNTLEKTGEVSPPIPEPLKPVHWPETAVKSTVGPAGFGFDGSFTGVDEQQGIEIKVEGAKVFVAGSHVDLNLSVESRRHGTKLENVQVVIKVIGTTFSPRLYAGKTDKLGNLRISFNLPNYTMGSAALIVQAHTTIGTDEVKYLIRKK
jgi:hypothetical protein